MNSKDVIQLEQFIKLNAELYYAGHPKVSDAAFDAAVDQLRAIDPENELLTKTGWGGGRVSSHLEEFPHSTPLSGLPKIKHSSGIIPVQDDLIYALMYKLDGGSARAYYEDGKLIRVLSRGDGEIGLDITRNLPESAVPRFLNNKGITEISGELVISKEDFEKCGDGYAHPRNMAVGLSQSKYAPADKLAVLRFVAFGCKGTTGELPLDLQLNLLDHLQVTDNIRKVSHVTITGRELKEISNWDDYVTAKSNYAYAIDGAVIRDMKSIGSGDGFALKFESESAIVNVVGVRWQTSNFGRLIPVIQVEPTDLAGATITFCSGFNANSIKVNKIGPGAKILLTRSNEVIPHWVETVEQAIEPQYPWHVGFIEEDMEWVGVHLQMKVVDFSDKIVNSILYHAKPFGMGGVGIADFRSKFNINSVESLSRLVASIRKEDKIKSMLDFIELKEGTAARSNFENLLIKLRDMRPTQLNALLWAWYPGLGEAAAEEISKRMTRDDLICDLEILGHLPHNVENSLPTYVPGQSIKADGGNRLIQILDIPWNWDTWTEPLKPTGDIKVALTGSLSKPRSELIKEWAKYGVIEVDVSKANYLITDNPNSGSSKNKTASKLGIPVITESEFIAKVINKGN